MYVRQNKVVRLAVPTLIPARSSRYLPPIGLICETLYHAVTQRGQLTPNPKPPHSPSPVVNYCALPNDFYYTIMSDNEFSLSCTAAIVEITTYSYHTIVGG